MKTKFVKAKYYYQARNLCPWASKVTKVCEGFMCFETYADYLIFKNQK